MTRVHMKRRNKDEIYVVGKATSCETTFEGVHCLSFSRQYKVAIASNVPSKFDPNVLVLQSSILKSLGVSVISRIMMKILANMMIGMMNISS
jgi:hypothetical protein